MADALGLDTVTDNMMDQARRQLNKATLESLNARGLPNEFVVFRGGVPDQEIVSVSLSPGTGRNFSTRFGRVQPGTQDASLFLAYRVRKQNILADTNAFSGVSGLQEEELFIRATDLTPLGEVVEAAPLPGEKIFTSVDQEVKDALDETGLRLVSPDDTPAGGGMFITRDGKMVGVRAEDIPEGGLIGGHDNFSEFILPVEKNINDQGFIRIIERPNELNIQVSHLDDLTPETLRALQVRATKYSSGTPAFIDVGVFREGIESIRATVDDIVDGRLLNLVRRAGLTPRTVTKAAPRIAEAAPEKIATALTADGNIIGLSKKVWTSKNSGVLGDELASELHQFLLAGTQTGGRKLHKDVRFIDELYEAYTPVREALREEFGDTIRLVRYQRGVEGPGDRLVVQFADPTFSKNFDPRVAPPTEAIGFTKGPAVDRELQRISRLTGQSRKDAYSAFKESALNKELEKTIEATRLKDKTPVFRYEVDVPIEDIVAMPTSTNGKYREFIVNSDVLRGVDATELPRAADGSLARVVEEVAEVVPKVVDPNILSIEFSNLSSCIVNISPSKERTINNFCRSPP